jgi:hypothetical protein
MIQDRTKFLCVSGPQGAGKSYLSKLLADEFSNAHGLVATTDAIAAPIYAIARALTGDDDFSWRSDAEQRRAKAKRYELCRKNGEHNVEVAMTGRELLQDIGSVFRNKYRREDFWVGQLVARNVGRADVVVVSDCRMPSEIEIGHALLWIEASDGLLQQRPEDETERHLAHLRSSSAVRLTRSGTSYHMGGSKVDVRDVAAVCKDVLGI